MKTTAKTSRLFLFGVTLLSTIFLLGLGCTKARDPWPEGKSPRVLASFPPLYCFAANVAGDDAAVLSLLDTTGPHEYQPSVQDVLKLRRADLFFINGLQIDNVFAAKLKGNSGNPNLPIIDLGELIANKISMGEEEHEHEHDDHGHQHGAFDPHVWLGIPEAIRMVEGIRDRLKEKDPAHAANYDRRAAEYIEKLRKLQEEGKAALQDVKKEDRKLIAFHDSLRYFARSFDLEIAGVIQVRAGIEPDMKTVSGLVELCKNQKVRVLAIEPQYPAATADALLKRIHQEGVAGAKTVEIDTLETAPANFGPDYYEKKMRENIDHLVKALKQ